MPVYVYKCRCGQTHERYRAVADRNFLSPCPICQKQAKREQFAETVNSTDHEYQTPVYSRGLGVRPDQVKEAQQRFPHHEFLADGRMVLRSHNQRKRVLKELGFFDKDGY